ncbi:hypothetical protein TH3_06725 [Thalassospira xiamenensis M-5 = DSM 17429]|uniref:Uncharacterized protein n=1 Tax=Thalassospira xiamenensis M-5 = DSM 17429 TaxID=1123366 RepID=A0AB72UB63_9PROT|nr:hypothetical protein TH3_06725 [Thalassospira xiamenensis M-5 = DSM 17429]
MNVGEPPGNDNQTIAALPHKMPTATMPIPVKASRKRERYFIILTCAARLIHHNGSLRFPVSGHQGQAR